MISDLKIAKKSKILITLFVITFLVSITLSYIRVVVNKDFELYREDEDPELISEL